MYRPLISVMIPVYNGEQFLANTIHAVWQQQYQPLEIIVVDDGSTDGTAAVAAQFQGQIRYFHQTNQGPAAARNRAIEAAQGEVFAFLDVDDAWTEGALHRMVKHLAAHSEIDIVRGLIQVRCLVHGTADTTRLQALGFPDQPYYFINLGSALYRRTAFEKTGLFDPSLTTGEDTDWFIRAWENRVAKLDVDDLFLIYQQHDRNMTLNRSSLRSGVVHIFKRHLDRRRTEAVSSNQSNLNQSNLNPADRHLPSASFPSIAQYCNGSQPYASSLH